jgi:periplasmic glucans biosynthesis protein
MQLRRRHFLLSAAAASLLPPGPAPAVEPEETPPPVPPPGPLFSFDSVKDMARTLSASPFAADPEPLPAPLHDLDYDHFRRISFRSEQAFWRDAGDFRVELFHRGFQYDQKVTINLVEQGKPRALAYAADLFDFDGSGLKPDFPATLGFAGFRLHYPLNRSEYFDEFAVFQGGSYFRLIGRGQHYGMSARGLAIDTAEPQGEEFPCFTQFWIVRPSQGAGSVEIYALLDSKSTTGAYRFVLAPGAETRAGVEATLYPRLALRKPGLGALTSMFLHGGVGSRPFMDLRPQVHDSDGLLLDAGTGEQLWRPLLDPRALRVSAFADQHPRGFGLLQRDRDFRDYLDPDEQYEARPSLWVAPRGDWAQGRVELVEIPSDDEINDNIVAYWVPEQHIGPEAPFSFAYDIKATADRPIPGPGCSVATRMAPAHSIEAAKDDRHGPFGFWIDFADGDLPGLEAAQPVEAVVTSSTGALEKISCRRLPTGRWRVGFVLTPDGKKDAELRAFLRLRGATLTETWTYRWSGE